MANAALEQVLFEELNSEPERPDDIDFTEPHRLYQEALAEDSNNKHARFGVSVTSLLLLTVDAEVNAAFDEWDAYIRNHTPFEVPNTPAKPLGIPIGLTTGSDGFRLPFEVVPLSLLAHGQLPGLSADPQLGRVQDIFRQRVIPKLVDAVTHLGVVASDPNYRFVVTPRMQGDDEVDPAEIDQADILALRAASSLLTAALRIAVAYEIGFAAYDSTSLYQAFQPGSGWMALATGGRTHMQTARTDMLSAIDDVDRGLASLLAETDSQDDDVIKIGPDGISRADIDEIRNRNLPDIRTALTVGYTRVEDWDGDNSTPERELTINAGNLLQNPVSDWKAMLPSYTLRITDVPFGSDYQGYNGQSPVEVTAPVAGYYSGGFSFGFDAEDVTWSNGWGDEFLQTALQNMLVEVLVALELPDPIQDAFASADFFGSLSAGTQTIQVTWYVSVTVPEACVYIPVIIWDANSFEEWTWPDPTFGALLPDIASMNELYDIFGFEAWRWHKEWVLDWTDLDTNIDDPFPAEPIAR